MASLAALEAELAGYQEDLKVAAQYVELAPEDPDAKDTLALLEEQIAAVRSQIAAAKADAPPPQPPPGDEAPPPPPKYDMSKHPKFRKQSPEAAPPPPPPDTPHTFNVRDSVMAKYSADKQWYAATIVSKTGSSADPVYTVTFKGYGDTETKRKHEIRPVHHESKKRKADGSPAVASTPSAAQPTPASPKPAGGHVISAAPSVDTSLVQLKREPSKVSDGPTRMAPEPKKLKGQKQLQKNQSNWQSWAAAGPKKAGGFAGASKKKESMFRTPDLPNAKVGFTGSGKPMQKDQARAKWNYGGGADDE